MSFKSEPQIIGKSFRFLGVAGVVLFFIFMVAYFFYGLQPSFEKNGVVYFKIAKGESFRSIGARLSQKNLVRSISVFKLYSILAGKVQKFQPGAYELTANMSVPDIVLTLTTPGKNEAVITVPEGVTIKDIDEILTNAGVIEEGGLISFDFKRLADRYEFLREANSLEGFLFPDTYRFLVGSGGAEAAVKFLDNFERRAWPILKEHGSWQDDLILASYLEREIPDFNDRTIVAGVLLKRLKMGMLLQVDATISYAKCNGKFLGCLKIRISTDDYTISSPYNTYSRFGWTPTPIANPGEEAIKAAISPKKSHYLYYLSAKNGKTIFAKTFEEHKLNKIKYL